MRSESLRCTRGRGDGYHGVSNNIACSPQTLHILRALWLSVLPAAPGAQAAMLWLNEVRPR